MAAVLAPSTVPVQPGFAEPSTAPWNRPAARRPDLRVLPGGRDATRRSRAVTPVAPRRLQVVAAGVVVAAVVALAVVGLGHLVGADAAASGPASPAASSALPVVGAGAAQGEVVVVRPGDTLWSIAASLPHSGDVRDLVDRLANRAGGSDLVPGQRIDVSGLG